jgi:dienelactone hydrolase
VRRRIMPWEALLAIVVLLLACGDDGASPPDQGVPAPDSAVPLDGGQPGSDLVGADTSAPPADGGIKPDTKPTPGNGSFDGCRSWTACKTSGHVCNLALGRCEPRSDWIAPGAALFSFHPLEVAAGDVLVLDGTILWSNIFFPSATVRIGGVKVSTYPPLLDNTRLLVPVTAGLKGAVEVTTDAGKKLTAKLQLKQSVQGVIACDGTTPTASGKPGASAGAAGPHGAGHVDLKGHVARLYYPAVCGGNRRPGVKGTWPLVVLMHGNGAGYLHYDYLGQFLATWGLVALLPDAKVDYKASDPVAISPAQVQTLSAVIKALHDKDLGGAAPHLAGIRAGKQLAWIGHSRGTARIQAVQGAEAALSAATKASIFLGPVDDGKVVPGHFLLLAGGQDAQSPAFIYDAAYLRQKAPKWKVLIPGGNHSLFSDHKVWTGFLDKKPTVTRAQQIAIITSFALPLLQRAFGLPQPFSKQLDSPPASPLYKVWSVPK